MAAIAWSTIEDAIHAWIVASTGLSTGNVIWVDQGGPWPSRPYVAMRLDEITPVGTDWRVVDDAPDAEPGAELRIRHRGMRTARLQLQCIGADNSAMSASKILVDAISGIAPNLYALDAAGIGIGSTEPIRTLEAPRESILESRALVDVHLHLASEVESRVTYVERVNLTFIEETIGEVANVWIPDSPPPTPET